MKWLIITVVVFVLAMPAVAQDDFPPCEIGYADLESEQATRVRNRNDRIEDLEEILDEFGDSEDVLEFVENLSDWAVFADSAFSRFDVPMPECSEYQSMMSNYQDIIVDTYRIAGQMQFIVDHGGDVPEHITDLLGATFRRLAIELEVWRFVYDDFGYRT